MGDSILIKNIKIYGEKYMIENGYLKIVDGKISDIGEMERLSESNVNSQEISFSNQYSLLPGFIDVHIHGAGGADTMDATTDALTTIATTLPKEGTTSFLATTITQHPEAIENALSNAANYIVKENKPGQAEVIGIHLEGPFISPKRAGAQPEEFIVNPNIDVFKKWQNISGENIKLVTLAPEEENGLALTKHLKETGVIPSIGHTDATYKEVLDAIDAGVSHTTHLFNQMRGLHHREPGVIGAIYLRKEIMAELIVDLIHVHPEVVNLTFQQIGKERLILITDAIRAKCLKNGIYDLGGQDVTVNNGKAQLSDGTLAGSILEMNHAVHNMLKSTDATLMDLVQMTAVNPAKELNIFDRKGSIAIGKDADIVILDHEQNVVLTICRGKIAYQTKEVFR